MMAPVAATDDDDDGDEVVLTELDVADADEAVPVPEEEAAWDDEEAGLDETAFAELSGALAGFEVGALLAADGEEDGSAGADEEVVVVLVAAEVKEAGAVPDIDGALGAAPGPVSAATG